MRVDKLIFPLGLLFSLTLNSQLEAGILRVESMSLFSIRREDTQEINYPFFEFFEASYRSSNNDLQLNTNFGASIAKEDHRDFDLYILDAFYKPTRFMSLRAGRSFNVRAAKKGRLTDSISLDFRHPDSRLGLSLSGGVEREVLKTSLKSTAKFIGASLDFRDRSSFPVYANATYTFRRIDSEPTFLDQHLIGFSAQKMLHYSWGPELLGNAEFKVNPPTRLNLVEGGLSVYSSYRTAIRFRAMAYETASNDDIEDPIFSIFSLGRLYEGSAQAEIKLGSLWHMSVSGSYDNYEYQESKRTHGYRFQFGLGFSLERFSLQNTAYFFDSYGGTAYGDRLLGTHRLSDRLDLGASVDVTRYEKITSAKNWAFNSDAWMGVKFMKLFRLSSGVEMNRNNALKYDFRLVAKLNCLVWSDL